ncbi:hypothetical protein C5167_046393 [Papaver somniferum]|uniref:Uncharacterized protein n=1 Tax=Papaver somniferum TaxID=3469 RepID=A0A4Y7LGD9_PAPSO|nr:uncharacterized protein LOC113320102 isoform X1 [Papaver somniferum]RZC83608.1 hypothetical protein C5167_046393 [Papaver somniferum]
MEMSREEDDRRQYQCLRKYEAIVKQVCGSSVFRFDELIDMMNARTRPPKRRRVSSSSSSRGSGSATTAAPTPVQPGMDDLFVQTITRFLDELNTTASALQQHDTSASNSTNQD